MIRPDLSHLPAYVPGARNDAAVKLSSNEIAEGPLPSVKAAMAGSLDTVNRYPDMGAIELRTTLARHLGLSVEQVAVGTGSSALCQQLVNITAQPGDDVIFPWRSFEAYPIFVHIAGANPVPVALTSDYRVDLAGLAAAITDDTKLIFVCNPNNPTATTITTREWREFMSAVPADVLVALDEAYFEYNFSGTSPIGTEEITAYRNVVGLRTFSKAYGLAGARVGYAFGPVEIIEALNKVAVPFSVSSVAQVGALASLDMHDELQQRVETTAEQRERLAEALTGLGSPKSQTNFVWIPAESISIAPEELAATLARNNVLVRAFPEGIRVTVTTAEETDAFLTAWKKSYTG
ncbi:Putative phenylalanine aminotransferase [Corynebacterium capitovis DSM 44611]|uniref:histidinol-phosphate transaminase n=1 Tax=Corynebacterium capitovis TaxID=131081 RepID=UPI000368AD2B|nr:histidinol-phosphate transaminase [Corynebacterium capitovis]WKD57975.1 Putative phenylalanine aminotransferase [Corynebacterium capitovis DSM 44611]